MKPVQWIQLKVDRSSRKYWKKRDKEFEVTRVDRFKSRSRYFSDSGIIGTKAFVQEKYRRIKHLFESKNEKQPNAINGLMEYIP